MDQPKAYDIRLAQEQLEELEDLAGAGYGPEKIALYFGLPKGRFLKEWRNEESLIRYHYNKGVMVTDALIGIKLAENAKGGNITAAQQLAKVRWEQRLQDVKQEIYYGNEIDGL